MCPVNCSHCCAATPDPHAEVLCRTTQPQLTHQPTPRTPYTDLWPDSTAHTHQHTADTPQTRRARPCPKCHSLPTCWWHSAAGLLKTFLEFKMTNGMPYGLHGQVPMAQMCKKCAVWYGTGVMSWLASLDSGIWRLHNLKSRYWSVIDSVTSITKIKLHCHAQCILQTAVHSVTWEQTGVMNQEEG